jgi:hypothetical protein
MSKCLKKVEAAFKLAMAAHDELVSECPDVAARLPPRPLGVLGVVRLDPTDAFWLDPELRPEPQPWATVATHRRIEALLARDRAEEELVRLTDECHRLMGWAAARTHRLVERANFLCTAIYGAPQTSYRSALKLEAGPREGPPRTAPQWCERAAAAAPSSIDSTHYLPLIEDAKVEHAELIRHWQHRLGQLARALTPAHNVRAFGAPLLLLLDRPARCDASAWPPTPRHPDSPGSGPALAGDDDSMHGADELLQDEEDVVEEDADAPDEADVVQDFDSLEEQLVAGGGEDDSDADDASDADDDDFM